jgi:hypothetical protein
VKEIAAVPRRPTARVDGGSPRAAALRSRAPSSPRRSALRRSRRLLRIWQEKAYLPGMAAIAAGVLGALLVRHQTSVPTLGGDAPAYRFRGRASSESSARPTPDLHTGIFGTSARLALSIRRLWLSHNCTVRPCGCRTNCAVRPYGRFFKSESRLARRLQDLDGSQPGRTGR